MCVRPHPHPLSSPRAVVSRSIPMKNDQTALKETAKKWFTVATLSWQGGAAAEQILPVSSAGWSPAAEFISLA